MFIVLVTKNDSFFGKSCSHSICYTGPDKQELLQFAMAKADALRKEYGHLRSYRVFVGELMQEAVIHPASYELVCVKV